MKNNKVDEKIYNRVKKIVAEVLLVEPEMIYPNSRFEEDLGADSLDMVSLIMMLEDEFHGNISEKEAEKMTTIKEAVDFIANKMKETVKKQ